MSSAPDARLTAAFVGFAAATRRRAPLYSRLSAGVAESPLVPELFREAPQVARVPANLFAAVHDRLLADRSARLAEFYPNLVAEPDPGDPVPEFLAFCAAHAADISRSLATRVPQTNEIGRSALLLAGFGRLEPGPKAHLDIGASAGLNLMLDRLAYRDGWGWELGRSEVVLECSVRGGDPDRPGLAAGLPVIGARLGLDANPIDIGDAAALRWLEACVWPDQADRFHRLEAAIELRRTAPVEVVRGDAVDDLAAVLDRLAGGWVPVVTTSWVLCYLPAERQAAWVAELDRLGSAADLDWIWAEAPDQVGILAVPESLAGSVHTVLGVTSWRDGVRTDRTLALCHPHGYWLSWV